MFRGDVDRALLLIQTAVVLPQDFGVSSPQCLRCCADISASQRPKLLHWLIPLIDVRKEDVDHVQSNAQKSECIAQTFLPCFYRVASALGSLGRP